MKFSDVVLRAAAEISGDPEQELRKRIDAGGGMPAHLDKELTDEQADLLMRAARNDPDGFVSWLRDGWLQVVRHLGHA